MGLQFISSVIGGIPSAPTPPRQCHTPSGDPGHRGRILTTDGIIDEAKRRRYYEKPCRKRIRENYENCRRIYNTEMARKLAFLMRKNRQDPWLGCAADQEVRPSVRWVNIPSLFGLSQQLKPFNLSNKSILNTFKLQNILPTAGRPELNAVFQKWPHQCP
eukprot:g26261.t1